MARKSRHIVNGHGRPGWVYFITNREDGVVKIGFASNRQERLGAIQTGNHKILSGEASFPAYQSVEKMLHRHFANERVRGEWFRLTDEMEELWDDVMDYQGMRCGGAPHRTAHDLLDDIDRNPVNPDDMRVILETIGEPWPTEFVAKIMPAPPHQPGDHP